MNTTSIRAQEKLFFTYKLDEILKEETTAFIALLSHINNNNVHIMQWGAKRIDPFSIEKINNLYKKDNKKELIGTVKNTESKYSFTGLHSDFLHSHSRWQQFLHSLTAYLPKKTTACHVFSLKDYIKEYREAIQHHKTPIHFSNEYLDKHISYGNKMPRKIYKLPGKHIHITELSELRHAVKSNYTLAGGDIAEMNFARDPDPNSDAGLENNIQRIMNIEQPVTVKRYSFSPEIKNTRLALTTWTN